ncbi:MAG: OadG family protein [Victivallales bacterium]|nr:OadG family protein [Victivallales bacterium]
MFTDGVKLMITGMGTVFIFLSLIIIIINLLSKVLAPYASILEKKHTIASALSHDKASEKAKEENRIVTAILTAIHKYRKEKCK